MATDYSKYKKNVDYSKYKVSSTPSGDYISGYIGSNPIIKSGSNSSYSQQKNNWASTLAGGLTSVFGGKQIGEAIGAQVAKRIVPEEQKQYITGPTGKQVLGDAIQVGATFLPGGAIAKGIGAGAKVLKAGNLASRIGKVGAGASMGLAYDVGSQVAQGKDFNEVRPGFGTAIGTAIPVAGPLARLGTKAGSRLVGEGLGVTTGTGYGAIKSAYQASKQGGRAGEAFQGGLRGKISPEEIVEEAKSALGNVISNRNKAYEATLGTLKTKTKEYDTTPIIQAFNKQLEDFGVFFNDKGLPDFSRSPGLGRYEKDLTQMSRTLADWGKRPGDKTIVGIDKLKQTLDDFRIGSSDSRKFDSFVTNLRNKAQGLIKGEPQYDKLVKEYGESTGLIKEIQRGLSLGDKAQTDTAFRKLTTALRTNNEFRKQLVEELNRETGGTLLPKIAGQQLSELFPRGLTRVVEGAIGAGAIASGVGIIPVLKVALVTSPRVIGEIVGALGFTGRVAKNLTKELSMVVGKVALPGDALLNRAYQTGQSLDQVSTSNMKNAIRQRVKPTDISKNIPQSPQKSTKLDRFGYPSERGSIDLSAFLPKAKGQSVVSSQGVSLPKSIPYKESGNLTTKILKDLEGKTTVSKQYILDATNRGELKQVERDITRQVLDTMPDTINVKEFADKVKSELLPLKVKKAEIGMGDINQDTGEWMKGRYENIALPDELRGNVKNYKENIYESPIKTSAGDTHFNGNTDNYFGHTRIEDMADNKTRRVIEVQSDLYQKGNLESKVPNKKQIEVKIGRPTFIIEGKKDGLFSIKIKEKPIKSNTDGGVLFKGKKYYYDLPDVTLNEIKTELPEVYKKIGRELEPDINKLQQYNDPTAHFRMVREEIKKASQDGKTKLQFPTGETAMKIEGLGQAENVWFFADDLGGMTRGSLKPTTELKVGESIKQGRFGEDWIITDVLGDGKFRAMSKREYDPLVEKYGKDYPFSEDAVRRYTEEFDISGKVDTNNPIYKFYEKDVQKYLSKFGGKRVVDDKGVAWIEVPIKKEWGKLPVEAFAFAPVLPLSNEDARKKAKDFLNRRKK